MAMDGRILIRKMVQGPQFDAGVGKGNMDTATCSMIASLGKMGMVIMIKNCPKLSPLQKVLSKPIKQDCRATD